MSFSDDIKKHLQKYNMLIDKVYKNSCEEISKEIANETGVSTGRLLGSWSPSLDAENNYDYDGGFTAWIGGDKDEGIANANKNNAMADLEPRIENTVNSLNKDQTYYFTNHVEYATQAEFDGWLKTDAYYMVTKARQNWQSIVNEAAKNV